MTKKEEMEVAKRIVRRLLEIVPPIPDADKEDLGIDMAQLFVLRNMARACFRELDCIGPENEELEQSLKVTLEQMNWIKHVKAVGYTRRLDNLFQRTLMDILGRLLCMIPHDKCTGLHKRRAIKAAQIIRHLLPAA